MLLPIYKFFLYNFFNGWNDFRAPLCFLNDICFWPLEYFSIIVITSLLLSFFLHFSPFRPALSFFEAFFLLFPPPCRAQRCPTDVPAPQARWGGGKRAITRCKPTIRQEAGDYVIQRSMHVHARSSFACPFVPRSFHVTAVSPPSRSLSFSTIHPIKFNFDAARRPFLRPPRISETGPSITHRGPCDRRYNCPGQQPI